MYIVYLPQIVCSFDVSDGLHKTATVCTFEADWSLKSFWFFFSVRFSHSGGELRISRIGGKPFVEAFRWTT